MQSPANLIPSEDQWLFETPVDLVCCITQDIFRDPVINAAGQVYERAAIQHHMMNKQTDPITNVQLTSTQLIPVYTLKSRAYEFREQIAKSCVQRAYSTRSCEAAVLFLRRAAELVLGHNPTAALLATSAWRNQSEAASHTQEDTPTGAAAAATQPWGQGIHVPGLSREVLDFLVNHPSSMYDAVALRIFADGLRQSGYVDQALQLYLRLVEYSHELTVQAAALRQAVACLPSQHSVPVSQAPALPSQPTTTHTKQQQQQQQGSQMPALHKAGPGCTSATATGSVVSQAQEGRVAFLTHFLESQQTFSAGQLLKLLRAAGISDVIIMQVFERVLDKLALQQPPPSSSTAAHHQGSTAVTTTAAAAVAASSEPGLHFQDLLLQYVQLRFSNMDQNVDSLSVSVQKATQAQALTAATAGQQQMNNSSKDGQSGHGTKRRNWFVRLLKHMSGMLNNDVDDIKAAGSQQEASSEAIIMCSPAAAADEVGCDNQQQQRTSHQQELYNHPLNKPAPDGDSNGAAPDAHVDSVLDVDKVGKNQQLQRRQGHSFFGSKQRLISSTAFVVLSLMKNDHILLRAVKSVSLLACIPRSANK